MFHLQLLAILILSLESAAAADLGWPHVTVDLRDGSRVVGQTLDKKLRFRSALLGEIALSIQDIRSVNVCATNSATLTTTAGDTFTVSFVEPDLRVKTSFGKLDLPVESILKVTVTGPFPGRNLPGLVALWTGDNGGKDLAGTHAPSVSPGITYIEAKTGEGFYFNGGANQILVASSPDLNFGPGQDFSIETWIEPSSPPPQMTDDILPIVDKRDTPSNFRCHGYVLCLFHGRVSFRMSDDINGNGGEWDAEGPDLFDGKFHQVAVTVVRNSTDGGKLYVDGQLVSTFDPTQESGDLSTRQPLNIGGNTCPGYYAYFHGLIDHAAIYNRALSSNEIKSLCPTDNAGVQLPANGTMRMPLHPIYNGIYDYPDPGQNRSRAVFP